MINEYGREILLHNTVSARFIIAHLRRVQSLHRDQNLIQKLPQIKITFTFEFSCAFYFLVRRCQQVGYMDFHKTTLLNT